MRYPRQAGQSAHVHDATAAGNAPGDEACTQVPPNARPSKRLVHGPWPMGLPMQTRDS